MYQKPNHELWTGRLDSETDQRAFRQFQTIQLAHIDEVAQQQAEVALFGYAIDEGVRLNQGRVGAKDGPDAIKRAFAGLPASMPLNIVDYGNWTHSADTLFASQQRFGHYVHQLLQQHQRVFLLGGGHDIAYAQYLGVRAAYPDQSIGVINIDAHFDNRYEAHSTSGTSFRQMLTEDENLDYFVLGIQRPANTQALFDYAEETGTAYVLAEELVGQIGPPVKDKIDHFINAHDVILFTVCMDVVDSAFAPGVSAAAVLGLTPYTVLDLARRILESPKVTSVSIAETNPQYDVDQRTAKLVAHLLSHFIHCSAS
ncbi:formimidoylglutamase [Staphylococcus coagulans]|uniref:formimidoylglutamase n=1 Tax=Staphylococcus coagulans TaxID=74706 RepID=UPI00067A286E|nr:formimidoylglutamase [Staphylococcus coagulans]AKS68534.1 formimidoylglutamase [Staphylococcus schleiferi]AKS70760.1 formimidoylglutamase [Staphylococcus schleiferi]MBA8764626.1 formimidoylglutamase [Staphylococcus coagulans]MBT2810082.1 formimidoylglutamase [Staphylococcus coagulans]MBT2812531.1 formimidoylglutamase [Staphylococcus coagulans]